MGAIRISVFTALLAVVVLSASVGASARRSPVASGGGPPAKSLLDGFELFQADVGDSPIEFSIVSMGISKVRGAFTDFSEALTIDRADLTRSSVSLVIRTRSLSTFNEHRDRDLKSADWFDVEKFPTAVFSSHEIVRQGEDYLMRGSLTLHGVTKDVEIPFTFNGWLHDVYGSDWAGFEGHAKLNRKDFAIVGPARSNVLFDMGKASVADDVELRLAVEASRPVPGDTLRDRVADSLWRAVVARGVAQVVKDLRALRSTMPDSLMPVNESRMNTVGYQLVGRGRPFDGVEMFKLQREMFPQSAAGPTGMAYAYAVLGDGPNAAASAEEAIAMNPMATRAMEILRRVRTTAGSGRDPRSAG